MQTGSSLLRLIKLLLLTCTLSICAFSQIGTPIRSVSTLPTTCHGGSSTAVTDMVNLVIGGISAQYSCSTGNGTSTGTWVQTGPYVTSTPVQSQVQVYNTSGVLVPAYAGVNVNPQTGNYTLACPTDRLGEIEFNISSAATLSLPQAGSTVGSSTCLQSNIAFVVRNTASSTAVLTITATTSTFQPEGVSSHTLLPDGALFVYSDATNSTGNYHAINVPKGYGGVNIQTSSTPGFNYNLTAADANKLVIMNCSASNTITVPSPVNSSWSVSVLSIGSVTSTFSFSNNYNGLSSVPLLIRYLPLRFSTDGSNYFGDVPPVAGTNITITPASNGYTVNAANGITGNPALSPASTPGAITQQYTSSNTQVFASIVKLTPSVNGAVTTVSTSDTEALGIIVSTSGVSGGATLVALLGTATCTFDSAAVTGHYVQISTTTAGECHDAGATLPTSGGTILGRVALGGGSTGANYTVAIALTPPGGSGGGGGDTITSPNSTINVGGTSTNTTLDVTGSAGEILAGATPALTYTPTLGKSGTAGTLSLFPSSGNFTTTLSSAATANNTVSFFATVPTNLHSIYCAVSGIVCTLTDAGYAYNSIPVGNITGISGTLPISYSSGTITYSANLINPRVSSYQVTAADFASFKTITVASGTFNVTLVASGSQPANGQYITVLNYGSGTVSIVNSGQNINGVPSATITISPGSASAPTGAQVFSDGTNYFASIDEGTTGTVTSVGLSMPSWLTVTNSPVTTSGTLTAAPATGQTSHQVIGTCGSNTTFTPCTLAAGDIPAAIPIGNIGSAGLSGSAPITIAGTGAIACATCVTSAASLGAGALVVGSGGAQGTATGNADFTYVTHTLASLAAGLVDFSAITSTAGFKVPVAATETATANGVIDFDTTNKNYHGFVNGADSIFLNSAGALTNNTIPKISISSGNQLTVNSSITDNGSTVSTTEQITAPSGAFGTSPPTCTVGTGGASCYGEGTAATSVSSVDDLHADSTQHALEVNNNNTGEMPVSRVTCVNVTPVSVSSSTTSDQNLMTCTLSANTLNVVGRRLDIWAAGTYSTAAASTATLTFKVKLCTVSGCGSGTVVTIGSWTTAALPTVTAANFPWNISLKTTTQTAGSTAAFETHGNLIIDANTTVGAADSTYADELNATVSSIDTTGQLFLQVTASASAASTSNVFNQRQGDVGVFN